MMLLVILCVMLCVYFIATRANCKSKLHKLPPAFPHYLPLIGHTHLLLTDTAGLWKFLQGAAEHALSNGGVIHVVFGTQIYYLIADAEDAFTASNACLQKHFAFDFARPWLGNGIITSSGEDWKRHRKLLQPALSLRNLYGSLGIYNSQAKKLLSEVAPLVDNKPFSPADYLKKIALETFCMSTLGVGVDDKVLMQKYMSSVETLLQIVIHRFKTFWLHNDFLFSLSGLKKKEQEAIDSIKRMSKEVMQRKKAAIKNITLNDNNDDYGDTGTQYKPVLDMLLEQAENGRLTDEEIREDVDTLIASGYESTSTQLMYALLLLGAHQNVQDKMVKEILEVVGSIKDIAKDDINKLEYTNAVILESIRVLPSVPLIPRYVDRDVQLKNYMMRAGSQCLMFPAMIQHDPTWGPLGDKFIPERWLENPGLARRKEYDVFGLGKRGCIGKQYTIMSMKVFLAHFIRQYKVTADISHLELKIDFVLKPVAGHDITIERRNLDFNKPTD